MNPRIKRINDFDEFRKKSKDIFESFAKRDSHNKRLDSLFSLCICPGGRDGGQNKKVVEIFYGNRPIDEATQIDQNLQTITKLETAHGATLAYFRTDNGHVICNLYPAKSENQKPLEEAILLDYIKSPSDLEKKAKSHWDMFVSYMETTCIDGEPSLVQELRVFYLLNFKQYIVNKTVQVRRVTKLFKEILKYVLTIGLSGFLILAFTLIKENYDDRKKQAEYEKLTTVIDNISKASTEISINTKNINESLQKIAELQNQNAKNTQTMVGGIFSANNALSAVISEMKNIRSDIHKVNIKVDKIKESSNKANSADAKSRAAD